MEEEDSSNVHSSNEDAEDELTSSGTNDFCVLSTDDIRDDDVLCSSQDDPPEIVPSQPQPSHSSVDSLEEVKRKAQEIADSLQKVRVKSGSSTAAVSQTSEPPEDLKRHRERSLYVARKLQEDKMLFEESKKRNETVFDKVRLARRIHQNITENVKELKREDGDELSVLKLKIDRLESTISHLKESLAAKNGIISERNETIRTLKDTVTDVHEAHQRSLEQSAEEMANIKNEYTKAIEEISNSKNEVHSQLQITRKKYLMLENDLKLSDFARCRLVSRNAELREHINRLENENEKLVAKINDGTSPEASAETDTCEELRPKIENLIVVANEFQSLLDDEDIEKDELNVDNDDDLAQIVDQIGDRLESCFYAFRDKLASVSKSTHETKKLKDLLAHLSGANNEAKNVETRLQEQVAALQSRLSNESHQFDDLRRVYENIVMENEQLKARVNELLDTELTGSKQTIDELQNESRRLQNELKARTAEHNEARSRLASLQSECEELRRANDASRLQYEYERLSNDYETLKGNCSALMEELATKSGEYEALKSEFERQSQEEKLENDFVVLQNRDYDEEAEAVVERLRRDNETLMENVRVMNERAVEHENEKLAFSQQLRQLHETVARLQTELETARANSGGGGGDKDDEIEGLQNEMSKLLQELNKVWDQLHDEKTVSHELKQQLTYSEEMNAELSNEVRELRERCRVLPSSETVHELETCNRRLQDELETAVAAADRTNDVLRRLWQLTDRSATVVELADSETVYERVKYTLATISQEAEALRAEMEAVAAERDSLRQATETLDAANRQLQSAVERERDASDAQLAQIRDESSDARWRVAEMEENVGRLQHEVERLNGELETTRDGLRRSEEAAAKRVADCANEVDALRAAIVELNEENGGLRAKCESHRAKYVDLFAHVNDIVARAKTTSDEAIRIVGQLQTRSNVARTEEAACQYDEQLAAAYADDLYERGRRAQTNAYEGLLDEMRLELNALQSRYAGAKEQLLQKDDECNAEIAKYEEALTQLRGRFNETRDDLETAKRELAARADEQSRRRPECVEAGAQTSAATEAEQSPPAAGLASFFKDNVVVKAKDTLAEMLRPEPADYSQWILPEADSEFAVERPTQQSPPPSYEESRGAGGGGVNREPLSVSDVLDRLKSLIAGRNESCGWDVDEEGDWSGAQLDANDDEFVNVAFKFVDLFDVVYRYYASVPQTEPVLGHFRSVVPAELESQRGAVVVNNDRETFEQLVNLATYFENESKCLADVVTFVEDLTAAAATMGGGRYDTTRIVDIVRECRQRRGIDESDIVDAICEEYDIVPEKFTADERVIEWRENMAKSMNAVAAASSSNVETASVNVEAVLKYVETLRAKVRRLICDLHDATRQNTFDAMKFFEQIEDISLRVENSVRLMQGKEVKQFDDDESKDDGHHDHDDEEDEHEHHHHHHHHHHEHEEEVEIRGHDLENAPPDEANELKSLLAESNKKIGSLVTELMEVKNSREYNEVVQLHAKLDETLYQLHLRDVHVVELTRELTQLLSERDELQLKLSNIIRQNEQLRESKAHHGVEGVKSTELENKLGELHAVDYMKDPRIAETSKQYHETEMQLYNVEATANASRTRTESGGFSVPSLLKWIAGDTN